MEFYSLVFIFAFLPAAALLYRITPPKYKNPVTFFISCLFFALCQPKYFHVFLVSVIGEFIVSELIRKTENKEKVHKALFILSIVLNVSMMLISSIFNQLYGTTIPLATMVVCFTSIGYFTDTYKKEEEYLTDFWDFAVFIGFFGKMYRGPLMRVSDYKSCRLEGKDVFERSGDGIYLFIRGCAKYVILAGPLKEMYTELVASNFRDMSVVGAWLSVVTATMSVFYDLSAFCDMARGTGLLFDMKLPKNFYFPFQSPSVTDFLDRFNMTVTGFFKHYVYDVLRTKKDSVIQFCVDSFLVSMLCGIWFGVRINNVLWGIYIAVFVIIEKLFLGKVLEKIPKIFARLYSFCITIFSMTLLSTQSHGLMETLSAMFFASGVPTVNSEISYLMSENALILIAGAFFLTSTFNQFIRYLKKKHRVLYGVTAFCETLLLLALIVGNLI